MVDPSPAELAAMGAASDAGGRFIESMPSTDMATWTAEQWHSLIEAVCGGYVGHLVEQQAAVADALRKVAA